jgi:lipoate-protein ligase B
LGQGDAEGAPRRELWVADCGLTAYDEAHDLQQRVREARIAGLLPDVLLTLQHPPVYTRGRRAGADELPLPPEWYAQRGIEIRDVERGGKTTYHGPGQLVAYPIVDTGALGVTVPALVDTIEQTIVEALAVEHVTAAGDRRLRGVWTPDGRKIASIGLHVSHGVTMHGLAVNVDCDLEPFSWIRPCGLDVQVTSVAEQTGRSDRLRCVTKRIAYGLAQGLGLRQRLVSRARLERELAPLARPLALTK